MKAAFKMLLCLAVVVALVGVAQAADKEVTLKGVIQCSKCSLKKTEECGNAIVVTKGGKKIVYYFDDDGKGESYHKSICTKKKKGSVTGVVSKKDGKNYIKPAKDGVKFD